jgi:hypothetical protein
MYTCFVDIRPEVKELMRVAERVIGFAHQNGGLTEDECSVIMYYAKELEREMAPFCPNHCELPASK